MWGPVGSPEAGESPAGAERQRLAITQQISLSFVLPLTYNSPRPLLSSGQAQACVLQTPDIHSGMPAQARDRSVSGDLDGVSSLTCA